MPCSAIRPLDADVVREAARGLWRTTIYPALNIEVGIGKHMPCPFCGGKDRFRCDNREGSGSYFCNQCGAGDGFSLVMKVFRCDFAESLRLVANTLGVTPSSPHPYPRPHPRLPRMDRRRIAFQLEQHGVTLMDRASAVLQAAGGLVTSQWTDLDFDAAMNTVAQAFQDSDRANLLFDAADSLREKAFMEEYLGYGTF